MDGWMDAHVLSCGTSRARSRQKSMQGAEMEREGEKSEEIARSALLVQSECRFKVLSLSFYFLLLLILREAGLLSGRDTYIQTDTARQEHGDSSVRRHKGGDPHAMALPGRLSPTQLQIVSEELKLRHLFLCLLALARKETKGETEGAWRAFILFLKE